MTTAITTILTIIILTTKIKIISEIIYIYEEWLMVSKKPGAYKYAHRKHEVAEDKYFKVSVACTNPSIK